ncbi:MAG: outer membrane lipoprotein-sorting protein [Candidatus Omnitrophica bacterium]|nr:outer membrane lipoprotein-sorting protein [Candidatus Omnitrophota bacterium]
MNRRTGIMIGMLIVGYAQGIAGARAEMGADEIARKAYNTAYYEGDDGRATVEMTLTDRQERTRKRKFQILRYDIKDGGRQKYYVYFREPADVREMVYMVWKHVGSDDDRWLYLPALDLVRRIAASDKRSSFVGSDFTYEDISGRSVDLDSHELVSSEGGKYLLKNTPKDPDLVEFSYYLVSIDKETMMPVKAEYFDAQGEKYREINALEVKEIQGHPTIIRQRADDLAAGSHTIVEFSDIEYDVGISEDIFTERYLRRAPRRWLDY